jgi:hypothetical protein
MPNVLRHLKWISIVILLVVIMLYAIIYYLEVKKPEYLAKKNLLINNPNISEIYSLKNISGWGEGPEYSGIVEINGERCRIWTLGDGEIFDNTCTKPLK